MALGIYLLGCMLTFMLLIASKPPKIVGDLFIDFILTIFSWITFIALFALKVSEENEKIKNGSKKETL